MSESENRGPVRPGNQKPFDLPAGLVAAVGVHALLFVGLFTVFQWRTEPESFYAELWAPEDASGESVAAKHPKRPTNRCRKTPKPLLNPILRRRKLNVWKRNVWLKKNSSRRSWSNSAWSRNASNKSDWLNKSGLKRNVWNNSASNKSVWNRSD